MLFEMVKIFSCCVYNGDIISSICLIHIFKFWSIFAKLIIHFRNEDLKLLDMEHINMDHKQEHLLVLCIVRSPCFQRITPFIGLNHLESSSMHSYIFLIGPMIDFPKVPHPQYVHPLVFLGSPFLYISNAINLCTQNAHPYAPRPPSQELDSMSTFFKVGDKWLTWVNH